MLVAYFSLTLLRNLSTHLKSFLMVLWRGTVILCLPSVRYMWLPFWWTILNPALLRVFRILRHDRDGGFLDSYFHQLSFSFKLV